MQEYLIEFNSKSGKVLEKVEKIENLLKTTDVKKDLKPKELKEKKISFKRKKFKKRQKYKKKN